MGINDKKVEEFENMDGVVGKKKVPFLLKWWIILIALCSGFASILGAVLAVVRLVYNHKHPEYKLTKKQKRNCLLFIGIIFVLLIWIGSEESTDADSENVTYEVQKDNEDIIADSEKDSEEKKDTIENQSQEEHVAEEKSEKPQEEYAIEEKEEATQEEEPIEVVKKLEEQTKNSEEEEDPLYEFNKMTEDELQEFYAQYADNFDLAFLIFPMKHYAEIHEIELENFKKEQKKLSKWMSGLGEDDVFYPAATDPALFDGTDGERYEVLETSYGEKYLYMGETKKNRPDGYGILKGDGKMYIGEFKDGYMDGYGILFSTLMYEKAELFCVLELGCLYSYENDVWWLEYEGEFSKGEFSGKGNWFDVTVDLYAEENMTSAVISVGDFKENLEDGDIKIYGNGMLLYTGEIKKGKYHGKGTSYYIESEQIAYKGEFKNGKYHGKGTKYNADGSVFHKGKWEMGDPYK